MESKKINQPYFMKMHTYNHFNEKGCVKNAVILLFYSLFDYNFGNFRRKHL